MPNRHQMKSINRFGTLFALPSYLVSTLGTADLPSEGYSRLRIFCRRPIISHCWPIMRLELVVDVTVTFNRNTGRRVSTHRSLNLNEGRLTRLEVPRKSVTRDTIIDFYERFNDVEAVYGIDPMLKLIYRMTLRV